jgi:SH3-like domain-containing protein
MQTVARARRGFLILGLALIVAAPAVAEDGAGTGVTTGASGLPVPRYVSLKSDSVNVRRGPSRDQAIVWRYVRAGMPVEITQEFENWRRIRDFEGAEGWVFHSLLSGTRTAIVAPWDTSKTPAIVYARASTDAAVVARVEPGVQARVDQCDGAWCKLDGDGFSGWIGQPLLWGVYSGEKF